MKTDVLNTMVKWLDHNRYTVLSLILFTLLLVGMVTMVGCESRTAGLVPDENGQLIEIDRPEFHRQVLVAEKDFAIRRVQLDARVAEYNQEVESFNQRVEAGLQDLDRQDAFRQEILDTVGLVATEAAQGTINPVSLIPIGIGLLGASLGLGTSADNRRKDAVITKLKTSSAAG